MGFGSWLKGAIGTVGRTIGRGVQIYRENKPLIDGVVGIGKRLLGFEAPGQQQSYGMGQYGQGQYGQGQYGQGQYGQGQY
jgi:hypothetical protein